MHTDIKKRGFTIVTLFIMGIFLSAYADGHDNYALSTSEVALLLPTGPDMEDQNDLARYQHLISLGGSAYPALSEILNSTSDSIVIGRILAIFAQSKADKAIPINSAKQLLARNFNSVREESDIRIPVARMLEEIGSAEDAVLIYPMLNDNNEFVRASAIRALSKIGDDKAIQIIEHFMNEKASSASNDEINNDTSLKEANRAIVIIRERLIKANNSVVPD